MAYRNLFRACCTALQLWLAAWAVLPVSAYDQTSNEESFEDLDLKLVMGRSANLPKRRIGWAPPWAPEAVATIRSGVLIPVPLFGRGAIEGEPDLSRQRRARLPRRLEPPERPRA